MTVQNIPLPYIAICSVYSATSTLPSVAKIESECNHQTHWSKVRVLILLHILQHMCNASIGQAEVATVTLDSAHPALDL